MIKNTTLTFIAVFALAVAGAATAGSASAAGGVSYVGETSQGAHLSLKVNARRSRVRVLYVDWLAGAGRCSNHRDYYSSTMFGMGANGPPGIRAGRFGARISEGLENEFGGTTVEQLSLNGRVNRIRASGRIQVQVTERDATGDIVNRCTTGQISWSALD